MAKNLVVCCDGTWNFADQPSMTNVTKIALAVRPQADGVGQRVYYGSGVGTRRWERLGGGAFGAGLSRNIMDAYRFLIDAYEPGDQLYLFGFSRGAFTARSLAGLVRNSGILRREHAHRIKEAWALYRNRIEKPTGTAATLFRQTYAHEPGIRFIGVWDTVGALGIPVPGPGWLKPVVASVNRRWAFHDTELSSRVKGAFHALAIDEQREPFIPTLWHQQPGAAEAGQELKQVWFAGVHCDVGGGYQETALSDITLLWMVRQARRHGLEFDPELLSATGPHVMIPQTDIGFRVRPDGRGTMHDSRSGFYLLSRPWHRPMGEPADASGGLDGCEYLSESAHARHDEDASYRPPELDRYLAQGRPRLEQVPLTASDAHVPPAGSPRRPAKR
ncbi:DUF2235 domain-containing protein [Streptomyces odontomachi]|uniref:DUF2235 domain-containing protein n=1 Tax=Streptomyces odontomachi TaxID=2944940 RepID=UPI00210D3870|nr:DUF2235 domain-containing protein [Streptomyces sp. ODS25]